MSEVNFQPMTQTPEAAPVDYTDTVLETQISEDVLPELYEEVADKEMISEDESDIEDDNWWAEELKRLDKYVNHEAKYHVGRKFMIGDETFIVSFSKPSGSNGNYTTPYIDLHSLTTGKIYEEITPEEVDAMIEAAAPDEASSPELPEVISEIIEQELASFDEQEYVDDLLEDEPLLTEIDEDNEQAPATDVTKIAKALTRIVAYHPMPEEIIDELEAARKKIDEAFEAIEATRQQEIAA